MTKRCRYVSVFTDILHAIQFLHKALVGERASRSGDEILWFGGDRAGDRLVYIGFDFAIEFCGYALNKVLRASTAQRCEISEGAPTDVTYFPTLPSPQFSNSLD